MKILTIVAPPDADLAYIFHNMRIPVSSATSEPAVQIGNENFRVEAMSYTQESASLSAVARTCSSMLWVLADLREPYSTRLVAAGASLLAKQSDLVYFVGYTSSRARGAMDTEDAKALQAALSDSGLELHVILSQAEYDGFRKVVEQGLDRARAVGIGRLDATAASLVRLYLANMSERCFGEEGEILPKASRLGRLVGEKHVDMLRASGRVVEDEDRAGALRTLAREVLCVLFGTTLTNVEFRGAGDDVYECAVEKHARFQFLTPAEQSFLSALCSAVLTSLLGLQHSASSSGAVSWKDFLRGGESHSQEDDEKTDTLRVEVTMQSATTSTIAIRVKF